MRSEKVGSNFGFQKIVPSSVIKQNILEKLRFNTL